MPHQDRQRAAYSEHDPPPDAWIADILEAVDAPPPPRADLKSPPLDSGTVTIPTASPARRKRERQLAAARLSEWTA